MTDAQYLKNLGYVSMYDFMTMYNLDTWRRGDEGVARTILHSLRDRARERWEHEIQGKSEDQRDNGKGSNVEVKTLR